MSDPDNKNWKNDGRAWFGVTACCLPVVLILVAVWQWDWLSIGNAETGSNSETLRNVSLLIAGVLALVFALWRAWVAERHANASQGQTQTAQLQVEIARQTLMNERYQRGAEMLGSDILTVRLGGIYALQRLANEERSLYHVEIMRLLCSFVRSPVGDGSPEDPVDRDGWPVYPSVREDVQAAVSAIGLRNSGSSDLEREAGFNIDLHGANLTGANLRGHNLADANLRHVKLEFADLTESDITRSDLTEGNLEHANLTRAILRSSDCSWAVFEGVSAHEIDLTRANLEGTDLTSADLENANLNVSSVKGTYLDHASLKGADLSGAGFGRGRRLFKEPGREYVAQAFPSLTQVQLDLARSNISKPPNIEHGTIDTKTEKPLMWRLRQ